MKVQVTKTESEAMPAVYEYKCTCKDHGILGSAYEDLLRAGATFSFVCNWCKEKSFVSMYDLAKRTLSCEFSKNGIGYIEL